MKLTWIDEYEAQPGELIEWRLHPATVASAAHAAHDPRPPSYMQEAHVRAAAMQRDRGFDGQSWLATAFDVVGRLDLAAFDTALRQWIGRHETLRSGLRVAGERLERFTLSTEEVALERSVVGRFCDGAEVVRHVQRRFDAVTDPLAWPPYLVVTVARRDEFTVYLGFDHSNVDGYSIAQIPHEIQVLYAAAALAEPGSHVDFSKIERDAADGVGAEHHAVVRWRDFVRSCGGALPAFPLDLGVAPGALPRQTGVGEWLLDAGGASAFDDACRAAGGNFLAGILAAAAAVAWERGGRAVFRTVIPFHTRTEARWAASLGWYIGLAPVEIPTAEARDFDELVALARAAARAGGPVARVPFAKACSLLGTEARPPSMVSFMDCRNIPGAARWREWNARAFGNVSYGDETYVWINRNVDGLYLTCRYPGSEPAHETIGGFIDHARAIVASVARTGTYVFSGHRVRATHCTTANRTRPHSTLTTPPRPGPTHRALPPATPAGPQRDRAAAGP